MISRRCRYSSASERGRGVESKSDDGATAAATKTVEDAPRVLSITAREAWLGRVHSTARLAAQYGALRARAVAAALAAGVTKCAPSSDLSPGAERRRHISTVRASKVRVPRWLTHSKRTLLFPRRPGGAHPTPSFAARPPGRYAGPFPDRAAERAPELERQRRARRAHQGARQCGRCPWSRRADPRRRLAVAAAQFALRICGVESRDTRN